MIRPATPDDLPLVRELWSEFEAEVPDAPWRDDDSAANLASLEGDIAREIVLLAERDGEPVGFAIAMRKGAQLGFLDILYVRPDARGSGVAGELVGEVVARLREAAATVLELEVLASNTAARAVYERWGFAPHELTLAAPLDEVGRRLAPPSGPTFGSVHAQTDDLSAVERVVAKVLPRLGRTAGTTVTVRERLGRRPRRAVRPRARAAPPARQGAVVCAPGGHARDRRRGGRGRPLQPLRPRRRRRRVPVGARVPRPAAAGDVVALGANPRVVAGSPAPTRNRCARSRGRPPRRPTCRLRWSCPRIAAVMGVTEADHGGRGTDADALRRAACPYCARVRIVLAEKDVEYEAIEIDLSNRPAWLTRRTRPAASR